MKLNFQKKGSRARNWSGPWLGLLAILLSPCVVHAEEIPDGDINYFVVTENDSTQILFPIVEKPVLTLNETTVNVNSDSTSYSAEVRDIIDFSFIGPSVSGISSISDAIKGIAYSGNSIIIKGLSMGETVALFDLKGVMVASYASNEENLVIDLSQIPTGVCILSTKNGNYKIKK